MCRAAAQKSMGIRRAKVTIIEPIVSLRSTAILLSSFLWGRRNPAPLHYIISSFG
jgi:hypothetical protein